ncbi:MAG: helix-turn-helix transcriptional regulator [Spirochaetes bacterium]|nr:helix-turn-helix transcriptional regulator [Spirochaetota bacterium]
MREIFGTICLAGAVQGVLLFFALIVRKNNRRANRHLSLFMIFMALDGLELYLGSLGHAIPARPYQLSMVPYSFIFGPSVFLYSALLTGRIVRPSKRHALLYAPFLAALAFNIIICAAFSSHSLPRAVLYADMTINGGGLIFESLLYAASLSMVQRYAGRLREHFSSTDTLKLSLFRITLSVLILAVFVFFLSLMLEGRVGRQYKLPDVIAILIGLGLGFVIALLAMIQPELFDRVRPAEKADRPDDAEPSPRYEKLRLPASEEARYVERLREAMAERRLYLREELTLRDLAGELSLPAHHLSMILNIHFRQNFYSFINGYRVEEVKRRLANPDYSDRSILSIAYDAGFNSKSTFNTVFKNVTGKTPKEYREDLSVEKMGTA